MARLFHANFHFEAELAGGTAPQTTRGEGPPTDRRGAWLALAEPGDLILGPGQALWRVGELRNDGEPGESECEPFCGRPGPRFGFVPWGWSRAATLVGKSHGCTVISPPLDVVETVNRRSFRALLELERNIAPDGLCVARSIEDVARGIERLLALRTPARQSRFDWLLKAEYGMAGREALRGSGPLSDPRAVDWVGKRLARFGVVIVEPWLDSRAEASLHFDIPPRGDPRFLGIVGLVADGTGTYRSSRAGDPDILERFASAIPNGAEVAARLQHLGYWGPLGLDVMEHAAPSGTVEFRWLQDLNARWTMGRLALESWRRGGGLAPRDWSPPTTWPPRQAPD